MYTLSARCTDRNQGFSYQFRGSLTSSTMVGHAKGHSEKAIFSSLQVHRLKCRTTMTPQSNEPIQNAPMQHVEGIQRELASSHPRLIGYLFWLVGFSGLHRFYFGKPLTGAVWFFTGGLLLVGWIVDLFLIPAMADEADREYENGRFDYSLTWGLLVLFGIFGAHRFYLGKIGTGLLYLLTAGLFGFGIIYDVCTLNDQIDEQSQKATVSS